MVEDISKFLFPSRHLNYSIIWTILCVVYSLSESIDVDETNLKVEQYKKDNAELIIAQQTKFQEEVRNQQTSIVNQKRQMEQAKLSLQVRTHGGVGKITRH